MSDFFSNLGPQDVIPIVAIGGSLAVGLNVALALIAAVCWFNINKTNTAAALKQDMLNRGMSADEIKTVLEAGEKNS